MNTKPKEQVGQWRCIHCAPAASIAQSDQWIYNLGLPVKPWYVPYTKMVVLHLVRFQDALIGLNRDGEDIVVSRLEYAQPDAQCACQSQKNSITTTVEPTNMQEKPQHAITIFISAVKFVKQYLVQQTGIKTVKCLLEFSDNKHLAGREEQFMQYIERQFPGSHREKVVQQQDIFGCNAKDVWIHVPAQS